MVDQLPDPITRTDILILALIARQDEQTNELKRISGQLTGMRRCMKPIREPATPPRPDGLTAFKETTK